MKRKNIVIWVGCALLFCAGAIWGRLLPDFNKNNLVNAFSVFSSIATCIAAIAAWRAADTAKQQSQESSRSIRWQMYKTHWDSFNYWLDDIERDLNVSFFSRAVLYDLLFPNNRKSEQEFSEVGDEVISNWHFLCKALIDKSCSHEILSLGGVADWAKTFVDLTSDMCFTLKNNGQAQLWLGGIVPTSITMQNYRSAVSDVTLALDRLSSFCFRNSSPSFRGMTTQFEDGFHDFMKAVINNNWHQHEFR